MAFREFLLKVVAQFPNYGNKPVPRERTAEIAEALICLVNEVQDDDLRKVFSKIGVRFDMDSPIGDRDLVTKRLEELKNSSSCYMEGFVRSMAECLLRAHEISITADVQKAVLARLNGMDQ